MLRTKASQLAWVAGALGAGLCLLDLALNVRAGVTASIAADLMMGTLLSLAFISVGVLVAARQPHNPIGWFLISGIYVMIIGGLSQKAFAAALADHPGMFSPAEAVMAALTNGTGNLSLGMILFFTVLYFPTGVLPTRRWKRVPWIFALFLTLSFLLDFFWPGPLYFYKRTDNPLGMESWAGVLRTSRSAMDIAMPLLFLVGVLAILMRYRRAGQVERQQIKWVFLAAIWGATIFLVIPLADLLNLGSQTVYDLLFGSFLISIPITLGISILRYRLWDIDLLIRRTLVYSVLTATLALVFFGGVALLQQVVGRLTGTEGSPVAIVISTLAIAALVAPLRRRIQDFIDRRFYRQKYNAEQALAEFADTARNETNIEALTGKLVEVVSQTMQPEQVSVWFCRAETQSHLPVEKSEI